MNSAIHLSIAYGLTFYERYITGLRQLNQIVRLRYPSTRRTVSLTTDEEWQGKS